MKANEMRRRSEEAMPKIHDAHLAAVMPKLTAAADQGETSVGFEALDRHTIAALSAAGYKVTSWGDQRESGITVSW